MDARDKKSSDEEKDIIQRVMYEARLNAANPYYEARNEFDRLSKLLVDAQQKQIIIFIAARLTKFDRKLFLRMMGKKSWRITKKILSFYFKSKIVLIPFPESSFKLNDNDPGYFIDKISIYKKEHQIYLIFFGHLLGGGQRCLEDNKYNHIIRPNINILNSFKR